MDQEVHDVAWFKIRFIQAGITGATIAKRFRPPLHRTAIYHVITGRSKSTRIRKAIAHRLKMRVDEIWPPEPENGNCE